MSAAIEVKDHGIEVINAPDEAEITIELLMASDGRGLSIHGSRLTIGTYPGAAEYEIVGLGEYRDTLKLARVQDSTSREA